MTGPVRVVFGHTADLSSLGKVQKPASVAVNFTMLMAGVTEFITADGYRVQLRIEVKGVQRKGVQDGVPVYDVDFKVTPKFIPALTDESRMLGEREN